MKTVEDLRKSREARETILAEFGEVPQSIMAHDKSAKAIDLMSSERTYASTANNGGHTGKLSDVFDVSNQSCRGEGAALSQFPQNIGRKLLLLYTKQGDTVVDPFAGHNSRMELCWRNNRNYFGNDLSHEFMEANHKIKKMLLSEKRDDLFGEHFRASIELTEGDSKKLPWEDAVGDFTITSPPYFDLEFYGNEPEQLGTGSETYEEFLAKLGVVIKENFRVLKRGAFCVWCVNDFRRDGKFHSYHEDTANLLRAAGFCQWDIAITDLGSPIRAAFAQQVIETKILPKRHEYCLVFRKP